MKAEKKRKRKVLVYGTGVIGSLTIHELCTAGEDVTVIARPPRYELLKEKGLKTRKPSGKREWVDYPEILSEYDGRKYDVIFSVMQNQQQEELLETLAQVKTRFLVLVGNNMTSEKMDAYFKENGTDKKTILYAFQSTAGLRHEDYTEVVTFGLPILTIGHLNKEMTAGEKAYFKDLFRGSEMKLDFMDDMVSWYRCHAAGILPIVYLAYIHKCDIRTCTFKDMEDYFTAGREVYGFLESVGTKIRPKGDEKNLEGIRGFLMEAAMTIIAKTKLGEEMVTNHCRNAVGEMQFLDERLEELRKKNPSYEMPVFDRLREEKPSWEELHRIYDKKR